MYFKYKYKNKLKHIGGGPHDEEIKKVLVHQDFIKEKKIVDKINNEDYLKFVESFAVNEIQNGIDHQTLSNFGINNIKYYFTIKDKEQKILWFMKDDHTWSRMFIDKYPNVDVIDDVIDDVVDDVDVKSIIYTNTDLFRLRTMINESPKNEGDDPEIIYQKAFIYDPDTLALGKKGENLVSEEDIKKLFLIYLEKYLPINIISSLKNNEKIDMNSIPNSLKNLSELNPKIIKYLKHLITQSLN